MTVFVQHTHGEGKKQGQPRQKEREKETPPLRGENSMQVQGGKELMVTGLSLKLIYCSAYPHLIGFIVVHSTRT